jgi:hypothetical protein
MKCSSLDWIQEKKKYIKENIAEIQINLQFDE